MSTSAETLGETQYHTITGTFQRPGSRGETNTHEGCLTISGGRGPPATDDVRAEIPTNRTIVLLIPKVTMSSAMSSESSDGVGSESASAENSPRPHRFSFSPASAPATASALTPSSLEALNGEGAHCPGHPIMDILLTNKYHYAAATTSEDGTLGLYHPLDFLIAKHPKVMSAVSNVLIAVGGIVLLPGVSAWANGTIFAHPAVTVAGAIAVVVGKWLRSALKSAAAKRAAQARLRGQGVIDDVNGRRRGRTERDRLLSVEFVV